MLRKINGKKRIRKKKKEYNVEYPAIKPAGKTFGARGRN